MDNQALVGKNIFLRPIKESDTADIVRWRANPKVAQNFVYRNLDEQTHRRWLAEQVGTKRAVQFIIVEKTSSVAVGSVFVKDIDAKKRSAEFGIFIGEDDARGKGIGSEAAKLLLGYAFSELDLQRIFLRVFAYNIVAKKSYEKIGFVYEGHSSVCIEGVSHDMIFMAITNPKNKED